MSPAEKKITGEAVTLRCAHGDTVLYPLADVSIEVDGITFTVRAALSDTSVLLGTDVPALGHLLHTNPLSAHTVGTKEALIITRAQSRSTEQAEAEWQHKEAESGVHTNSLLDKAASTSATPDVEISSFGNTLDDELFQSRPVRVRLTRQEKRTAR